MRISDWSSDVCSSDLGFFLATLGAVLFAAKAIVVKITYRYGIDAVTLIAFRMLFAMPFFAVVAWRESRRAARGELPVLSRRERVQLCLLGLLGYRSEEHTSELQSLMRISYAV